MKRTKIYMVGDVCFLPHPCGEPGYWMRTDRCVPFVSCPWQKCKAKAGEPCIGVRGEATATTHHARRSRYQNLKWAIDSERQRVIEAAYVVIEEQPPEGDGG